MAAAWPKARWVGERPGSNAPPMPDLVVLMTGASGKYRRRTAHRRSSLVAFTAAITGTLVYRSASSSATWSPLPGTAQPSPVTPRNGPLGTIAWPASGVSAAGISGIGVLPGPGASQAVPIASVAKVMTAYIILRDHPLGGGEPGPPIVVQPAEAAAYPAQARNGDSLVPVTAGEELTERQALEALLLPSADNMAWILARWDAGSEAAFTAQMNTTARRLGMTATRYTDPSGLSASTTSTAADQVRLAMAAMSEPALAQIMALRGAVIPVAGVVRNYNTLLGQDGITGIKTGSDTAAGGCILLAAWQQARGHGTLIVAATFDQPGKMATMLPNALQAGHQLVLALGRALARQCAPAHQRQERPESTRRETGPAATEPAQQQQAPAGFTRCSRRPGPGDHPACAETAVHGDLTCPRDLNTQTREIPLDRRNHAIRVTRAEPACPGIPRRVRYLFCCLVFA